MSNKIAMFKKIKKTIQKDLHKRYEQLEEKFLAFERRLYSHLEDRLERLETQFDQINELLVQQTGKMTEATAESDDDAKDETVVEEVKTEKKAKKPKKSDKKKMDALAELPGLGASFEKKLQAEGINSFEQLSKLHAYDIEELNDKIPGFKIRYERYEWRARASEKRD
jgi:predicted flap endonuclease-1-like 5' DNA nuclease